MLYELTVGAMVELERGEVPGSISKEQLNAHSEEAHPGNALPSHIKSVEKIDIYSIDARPKVTYCIYLTIKVEAQDQENGIRIEKDKPVYTAILSEHVKEAPYSISWEPIAIQPYAQTSL
jgi:hypothetical protein